MKNLRVNSASYFAQARAAAKSEAEFYRRLRHHGWIFHEATNHWTHPDHPGVEIMP